MELAPQELTNRIVSCGNTLLREAGRLFKPFGLTAAQFNVLNLLSSEPGGMRSTALAKALVVDPSSATYVVDRMESLGWIRREADAADRRARSIRLTPAGKALHAEVWPIYFDALKKAMALFDPETISRTTETLAHLQELAPKVVDGALAQTKPPTIKRRKAQG